MGKRELIIIGAGAAGLMAAAEAAEKGISVLLLEKMEKAGRKIRITGKGRCNITNTKCWSEFATHIHPKSTFFKTAFYNFSNTDTITFFEKIGLPIIVERGDRVYPKSGQSKDVADSLTRYITSLGVEISYNSKVTDIEVDGNSATKVIWEKNGKRNSDEVDAVIIATGGLSYPSTGSDGDGLIFARKLGHKITGCFPSLTALMPVKYDRNLEGLLLKNVEIELFVGGNPIQTEQGDLEFTNNGIEGPIGFKISRRAVKAMTSGERIYILLDLKPALSEEQIKNRIKRELTDKGILRLKDLISLLLPRQIVQTFLVVNQINGDSTIGVNDENISGKIAHLLKSWRMDIESFTSYERAVVTAGGVSLDEIVQKSMASKLYPNMFFAGEVIDLDADTGGYNLQIAFSTGYLAGKEAAHLILNSREVSPE